MKVKEFRCSEFFTDFRELRVEYSGRSGVEKVDRLRLSHKAYVKSTVKDVLQRVMMGLNPLYEVRFMRRRSRVKRIVT